MHRLAQHRTALHSLAQPCTAMHSLAQPCTALHSIAQPCTALHCIAASACSTTSLQRVHTWINHQNAWMPHHSNDGRMQNSDAQANMFVVRDKGTAASPSAAPALWTAFVGPCGVFPLPAAAVDQRRPRLWLGCGGPSVVEDTGVGDLENMFFIYIFA